jgi:hypothetical protein
MAKRNRSKAKSKAGRLQRRKKSQRWQQQRQQARSRSRTQARRQRRRRWRRQATWGIWQGSVRGSFKHVQAFLLALNLPLIATQRETLADFIVAALLANSCHLPQIAAFMPLRLRQRSRLRRLERLLVSEKVKPMVVMAPIGRWLLRQVKEKRLYLVLDFTTKQDRFLVAMVSLVWGKRTLPLAWSIGLANTKGVSRRALAEQVVRQVAQWVPADKQVLFIADREFRGRQWRHLLQHDLHWHFVVRLSADQTFVHLPDGTVRRLNSLNVQKGDAHFWTGVYLTCHRDGPYQMAAVWAEEADEPWLLISDLDDAQVLPDIYARRRSIESTFRDFKAYGFDLEASRVEDVARFDRLLLALALAYGWAVRIGTWLEQSGQRLLVDRGRTPKQSAYRLGRYWLVYLWSLGSEEVEVVQFARVPT